MPHETVPGISVIIVSAQPAYRAGLSCLLGDVDEVKVIFTTESILDCESPKIPSSTIVIVEAVMNDMPVFAELERIAQRNPTTQWIVVVGDAVTESAQAAFLSGALGVVARDASTWEFAQAVHSVSRGIRYVSPDIGAALASRQLGSPAPDISRREADVIRFVALGMTNREIAQRMFVSVRTVESHRRNVMTKLRLASKSELVEWALRHHLIASDKDLPSLLREYIGQRSRKTPWRAPVAPVFKRA